MEILVLLILIVANGLFAMSEIALVTARKARLRKLIDKGDGSAAAAVELGSDPTRFLSTIQIGITSISVLNGIVGERAFAEPFGEWLVSLGVPEAYGHYAATGLVVVVITYVTIVVGELVPKRIAQNHPELFARLVARPIGMLAVVSKPFVWLLTASTNAILRALGVGERSNAVTEEEIHAVLAEGSDAGVIERHEHTMVRNVFRLDDRQLTSLMIPRADVVTLDVDDPMEEVLRVIQSTDFARYPLVRGSLDDILGIVNSRKLLTRTALGGKVDLTADLENAIYVPETQTGMDLLDSFRASGGQLALVIDEYGEMLGLITLQDLVEAITGEFRPRNAGSTWAARREDGSWLLDGLIPLPELKDTLALATVPEEDRGRYHTLAGMIMWLTGRMPKVCDTVVWEGWRFEVVDMDDKKIDKVLASRVAAPVPPPAVPDAA